MKKSKKPWLIIASIILLVVAFFSIKAYVERPQDLGTELEYIGKSDYGCWFVCDSRPSSNYYFGTDLTPDELKTYFSNASFIERPNIGGGGGGDYYFESALFKLKTGDEYVINYSDDTEAVTKAFSLKSTGKKYIISINKDYYLTARKAF